MSGFCPVQQCGSANIDWSYVCRMHHSGPLEDADSLLKVGLVGQWQGSRPKLNLILEEDSEDPDTIYLRREAFFHLLQHIVLFVPFCLWPSSVFSQKCHSAFIGTKTFHMFFLADLFHLYVHISVTGLDFDAHNRAHCISSFEAFLLLYWNF